MGKREKGSHTKETIFTSQDAKNDFPLKEGQAQTHMIYPPYYYPSSSTKVITSTNQNVVVL